MREGTGTVLHSMAVDANKATSEEAGQAWEVEETAHHPLSVTSCTWQPAGETSL